MAKGPAKVKKLKPAQVEALLVKLEDPSSLTDEDCKHLADIVRTWAHVVQRAGQHKLSMRQLQRILGVLKKRGARKPDSGSEGGSQGSGSGSGSGSEGGSQGSGSNSNAAAANESNKPPPTDADDAATPAASRNRDEHGRRGWDDFGELPEHHHAHCDLGPGCHCPKCRRGKLYPYESARFVSITGQAPLVGARHTVDRLQCNLCKSLFTAALGPTFAQDGVAGQRLYSWSAASVVAIHKYFGGLPWYRQETLQTALGVSVPDASMSDLCERVADAAAPVARFLEKLAANAVTFFGDDTSALILQERKALRTQRSTGKLVERTGCHVSCVVAQTDDGHRIAVFRVGIQHTGELMDELLAGRDAQLPLPLFMADCLAANTVTVCRVLYGACNAHAVRRFKDLKEDFPSEAAYALERYKTIFENEATCHDAQLDSEQRLAYHREHSKPLLDEICEHGETLLNDHEIEPNSAAGEVYGYMVNNRVRLSAFVRHAGMPLDNNEVERTLRLPVRLRDNAPFFKNTIGAAWAQTVWTVGDTALGHGVNLLAYFNALQRHRLDVRRQPDRWVPWLYDQRLRELQQTGPPATAQPLSLGTTTPAAH